jgi:hypothetical protein
MKSRVKEIDASPYLFFFFFVLPISIFIFLKWRENKKLEEERVKQEAEREKSENEKPNFFLEQADQITKIVNFNFGKENREFQSQIDKKETFWFKKFKLVVQDVYLNGKFKEISFELFKKNDLNECHFVEKIEPKIDYGLW